LSDEKPRLGPWLRRYAQEEEAKREGVREYLVAGGVAVGVLALLGIVLLAFLRFPFPTLGVLVLVWGVGYVVYLTRRRRADLEDQLRRLDLKRDVEGRRKAR